MTRAGLTPSRNLEKNGFKNVKNWPRQKLALRLKSTGSRLTPFVRQPSRHVFRNS